MGMLWILQLPIIVGIIALFYLFGRKLFAAAFFLFSCTAVLINVGVVSAIYLEMGRVAWQPMLLTLMPAIFFAFFLIFNLPHVPGIPFSKTAASLALITAIAVILMAFSAVYYSNPLFDTVHTHDIHGEKWTAIYFSAVTLTTLGYGDIIPGNEFVRLVAAGEAITGYITLGVFVAFMVSRSPLSDAFSAMNHGGLDALEKAAKMAAETRDMAEKLNTETRDLVEKLKRDGIKKNMGPSS